MKKLLYFLLLISGVASGQTLYVPSNADSLKLPVNVAGAVRSIYVTDILKNRVSLTKYTTDSSTLRGLVNTNTTAIAGLGSTYFPFSGGALTGGLTGTTGTFTPSFAASSGTTSTQSFKIQGTINNTGSYSGTHTSLLINPTLTSVTGTTVNLIDAQVGGTSKFKVDNSGVTSMASVNGTSTAFGGTKGLNIVAGDGIELYTYNSGAFPTWKFDSNGDLINNHAWGGNITSLAGTLNIPSIIGSIAANGTLTFNSTTNATKTSGGIIMQPSGGLVGIGTSTPRSLLSLGGATGEKIRIYDNSTAAFSQGLGVNSSQMVIYCGTGDVMSFVSGGMSGTERWKIDASGNFLAGADNTYDIGASGANRPRSVYTSAGINAGTSMSAVQYVTAGAAQGFVLNNQAIISSPSSNTITLSGYFNSNFSLLQIAGTTSSFPAIKRNGAGIDIRLADDSGPSFLNASTFNVSTTTTPSPASGTATFWFDGTNVKVTKNVGGTVTTSTIF